jgi:DNA-binding protein YbaB
MKKEQEKQKNMKEIKVSGLSRNEDVEVVMDGTQEILEIGINDEFFGEEVCAWIKLK